MNFERVSGENVHKAVDNAWKAFFGRAISRDRGITVITDAPGLAGYRGIYVLQLGEGITIGAPPDIPIDVEGVRFTREDVAHLAGDLAGLVLGPSQHAYTDEAHFVRPDVCDARRITEEEAEPVKERVPREEWSEGGFGEPFPDVAYGCFDEGELVAVGKMSDFAGHPADVGLVTRTDARGKGYGTRLAGAMMIDAFKTTDVLRYRALFTNAASLKVAEHLGFIPDGANIAVRLRV